jgi:tRNA modification GTPase
MHASPDTIAAIATAPGEGSVAIVRISGPESLVVADAAFRGPGLPPTARRTPALVHGHAVSDDALVLDEVLLLIMRGPGSFTGEDVVEFQCHGGAASAARILQRLVGCGCRPAAPGEFTRRAFLNGRIDLTQAEAVLDLVRAHSDRAAAVAMEQLRGALRRRTDEIYEDALRIAVGLESSLDFPEDDLPGVSLDTLKASLQLDVDRCRTLAASCREGRLLRDGIRVVIAGRPNVGKSSIFNLLVGRDRTIVSPHAGTTRDTVEEWISIDGYGVRLVDTAGIRPSACPIEQEGVRRAIDQQSYADLILYVIDANYCIDPVDERFVLQADPARTAVVVNKTDLTPTLPAWTSTIPHRTVRVSCMQEDNKEVLALFVASAIRTILGGGAGVSMTVSERHRRLLDAAADFFQAAIASISSGELDGVAPACSQVRCGLESLGQISGRVYSDELLDGIFSKFCIGK